MILRKYQSGNKFIVPVDYTKSETTSVINGPVQNFKNKQYLFKSLKDQALMQADKQLKRGAINAKEYKEIKKEIKSSTNSLDLEKTFEGVQQKLLRATKTPVLTNAPVYQDKEFTKEFFEKAEDKDRGYIGRDLLPNLGRAAISLTTKGNLSDVPKNYELYKRYGVNMPTSGGYGDLVMTEDRGNQLVESFNPFRSAQDLDYNLQDKDYGKAIVNAVGTLPLLKLTKPTAKLLIKAGETLRGAQPISTVGLPARLATNANVVNRFVNLTGVGVKGAGYGVRYGADNVLDLTGFAGSNKLMPKPNYSKQPDLKQNVFRSVATNTTENYYNPVKLNDIYDQMAEGVVWNKEWMRHPATLEKIKSNLSPMDLALNDDLYLRHTPKNPKLDDTYNTITGQSGGIYLPNTKEVFINRNNPAERISDVKKPYSLMAVHEGRHAYDLDNDLLKATGAYKMINDLLPERSKKAASLFRKTNEKGEEALKELKLKDEFSHNLGYIASPEEIAAHVQELRHLFKLQPNQEITTEMAKRMHDIVKTKSSFGVTDAMFGKHVLGSWDNVPLNERPSDWKEVPNYANAAKVFNKLYAITPIIGASSLLYNNKK